MASEHQRPNNGGNADRKYVFEMLVLTPLGTTSAYTEPLLRNTYQKNSSLKAELWWEPAIHCTFLLNAEIRWACTSREVSFDALCACSNVEMEVYFAKERQWSSTPILP